MEINIINMAPDICKVDVLKNEPDRVDILISGTKDDFAKKKSIELRDVERGATIELGGREYVVLDHDFIWGESFLLSKENIVNNVIFGEDGDFRNSNIYKFLNAEFLKELSAIVGKDNVLPSIISLKALDGTDIDSDNQKTIGGIEAKIGILTLDDFRSYKSIIPDTVGDYWLATRVSWTTRGDDGVCCVDSDGIPYWNVSTWHCGGIRPYFALKNSVKVNLCEP